MSDERLDQRRRTTLATRSIAIAVVGALAALGALEQSNAQRQDPPRITVAPIIAVEPGSQALVAIKVEPPGALPNNIFLRLRGLPPSVSLTEGHLIAPGLWAVPLFALSGLKVNIPGGMSGRGEIVISLVAVDGRVLAETKTALVVLSLPGAAPEKQPPEALSTPKHSMMVLAPAARPPDRVVPQPPVLTPDERVRAERLLKQGDKYLTAGNIVAARDFYERATEAGLAEAAIRLAATYDPSELARIGAQGVVPDRVAARKWYERAKELGAPEAVERLARLGGN